MNSSILTAIESLCDDIATNTNPEENKKRAEAVVSLAFAGIFTPSEYDDEAEENETAGGTVPKPGERFTYNGMEFAVLGEEQGGILAVMTHELGEKMPYDADKGKNDWRKSTLRKYLNGEFLKKFNRGDLLPFVSDLTSDDGMKDYGTAENCIALLSCDLYRKCREFMPKYNTCVWTITPWSCQPGNANIERVVYTDGSVGNNNVYNANGVAPACVFNRSIFE